MTRHSPVAPAADPVRSPGAGSAATLYTADASKVSGRSFLDGLGLSSPEIREARRELDRAKCIAAIKAGRTHGFPPSLVAECCDLIADEDATETGWALAEKSAWGMTK